MSQQPELTATLNLQWAHELVAALRQAGVRQFFVAPGSRSTPLVVALGGTPEIEVTTHFDERALAFACLGFGRGRREPAAFVSTSGTAVANALPAVIEASLEHVPMLLITADRPPELRDTGANQTIQQPGIFGNYTEWAFDLPCPDPQTPTRFITSTVHYAAERSRAGPVHINCMFREPFGGSAASGSRALVSAADAPEVEHRGIPTSTGPQQPVRLAGGPTIVIAGDCDASEWRACVEFCARTGAVLLGDIRCGARGTPFEPALRSGRAPRPRTVVHVGGRLVSARWHQFLAEAPPAEYLHVSRYGDRINPGHLPGKRIRGDAGPTLAACTLDEPSPEHFFQAWSQLQRATWETARQVVTRTALFSEPAVALAVAELLPDDHGLFIGNSLPIRDCDMFMSLAVSPDCRTGDPPRVAANRGASGIDGNLATARGFAAGTGRPTTVLVGDLTLLHDLNSLALLRSPSPPLQVIVLNNNGGAIFQFLPIAERTDELAPAEFERLFVTPHGLTSFRPVAELFGLAYHQPKNLDEFRTAYRSALAANAFALLEVRTDRADNWELHRAIDRALRETAP